MKDGRKIYLLGEGRLINLAAAEGHPASVMDMSFANQALSAEYLAKNHKTLEKKVYPVPEDLDKKVARLKLESMGVKIDKLTPEQEEYLASGRKERNRNRNWQESERRPTQAAVFCLLEHFQSCYALNSAADQH